MLERTNLAPEMISEEELKLEPFIHQVGPETITVLRDKLNSSIYNFSNWVLKLNVNVIAISCAESADHV